MLELLGLPPQAAAHAAEIDNIISLMHWLMAVLFVGWGLFFLYTLVRFRQGANPVANPQGIKAGWSKIVEAAVVIVEVVILVFFSIPAYSARVTEFPEPAQATEVRVVAEQFAWNIHYPGPDGAFGRTDIRLVSSENPLGLDRKDPAAKDDLTTINQFNMPVDKPVLVHLTSKDVIHSLGLPQMRVKQDAIPGMVQPVWFTPTSIGEWEVACSQLCGLGHYRMRGFYAVQTAADYAAWLAEEAKHIPH
jgi:cytochrome c oxidase subunit 2